jgi:hypothetical protein
MTSSGVSKRFLLLLVSLLSPFVNQGGSSRASCCKMSRTDSSGIVQLEPAKKKKSGDNNFLGSHFNVKYDFMITKRAHFKKKGKLLLKVDGAAVSVHADYPQQLVLGQAVL